MCCRLWPDQWRLLQQYQHLRWRRWRGRRRLRRVQSIRSVWRHHQETHQVNVTSDSDMLTMFDDVPLREKLVCSRPVIGKAADTSLGTRIFLNWWSPPEIWIFVHKVIHWALSKQYQTLLTCLKWSHSHSQLILILDCQVGGAAKHRTCEEEKCSYAEHHGDVLVILS